MSDCCCNSEDKLIFACSGAADVGALSDRAARQLTREGAGKMFCLAGIGGRVPPIIDKTKEATDILAIDGCASACVRNCLEQAGFKQFKHLLVEELGLRKGQSPASDENIEKVAAKGRSLLQVA